MTQTEGKPWASRSESKPIVRGPVAGRVARVAASVLAAVTVATAAAPAFAEAAEPQGVILLSWDGVRYDTLYELMHWQPIGETPVVCPSDDFTSARMPEACGDWWSCLPNICRFDIRESSVVNGKTLTRVQHASMLTGEPPEATTIQTNNGTSRVPVGMTIYERLHAAVGNDIGLAHVGSFRYTARGIIDWVEGTLIPLENILTRGSPDHFTGDSSLQNLVSLFPRFAGKPFFAFTHLKGADVIGHAAGDRSPRYPVAIVALDRRLGELISQLEFRGMSDRTQIFITTDHGFWFNTHLRAVRPIVRKTWFASQKSKLLCYTKANVLDVTPTVLAAFGVDPSTSAPAMPGRSMIDPDRVGDCVPPVCGDGIVEVGEDCEPGSTVTDTCEGLGFLQGELSCGADCRYDTTECAEELALSKLSIAPSVDDVNGGFDLQIQLADRDRGGPDFDPTVDAVEVEVLRAAETIWSGGTENYDSRWRIFGETSAWIAPRGSRDDGLVAANISAPSRRMKMKFKVGSVEVPENFLASTQLRLIVRAGNERFDADVECRVSRDETTLRCLYRKPDED